MFGGPPQPYGGQQPYGSQYPAPRPPAAPGHYPPPGPSLPPGYPQPPGYLQQQGFPPPLGFPQQKKSNGGLIAGIVCMLLGLVVISGGVYFYLNGDSSQDDEGIPSARLAEIVKKYFDNEYAETSQSAACDGPLAPAVGEKQHCTVTRASGSVVGMTVLISKVDTDAGTVYFRFKPDDGN